MYCNNYNKKIVKLMSHFRFAALTKENIQKYKNKIKINIAECKCNFTRKTNTFYYTTNNP